MVLELPESVFSDRVESENSGVQNWKAGDRVNRQQNLRISNLRSRIRCNQENPLMGL